MIRRVYIPAPEPVSAAPLARNTLIALAVYAAFLVGIYGYGVASLF